MDFLKDCMNDVGNPPIDAMTKNWCLGCGNRGCERAGLNNSAFDRRVKSWKETLFLNVPRAASDDPAYDNIRSKSFSPLGQPEPPKTILFTPGVPAVSIPVPMARPSAFVRQEVEKPEPEMAVPAVGPDVVAEPEGTTAEEGERKAPPGNTTFEQGTVLGGGPPPAQQASPGPAAGAGKTFILEDD